MGKQRPKFARMGKFTKTYTPEKTVSYETLVKEMYALAEGEYYENKQLMIDVKACFSIPESKSKKVKDAMREGTFQPTKKPDCDNILKIICDALNGVAYKDDSQIVAAGITKWYADKPEVRVTLSEVA
jgi:Holliday junction resolvase RusA-like endonuclease